MEYFQATHSLTHKTLKLKNGYIVEYTNGVYIIFVVYVKYMQSIQYHVFGIFWHPCNMLIRCNQNMVIFLLI